MFDSRCFILKDFFIFQLYCILILLWSFDMKEHLQVLHFRINQAICITTLPWRQSLVSTVAKRFVAVIFQSSSRFYGNTEKSHLLYGRKVKHVFSPAPIWCCHHQLLKNVFFASLRNVWDQLKLSPATQRLCFIVISLKKEKSFCLFLEKKFKLFWITPGGWM